MPRRRRDRQLRLRPGLVQVPGVLDRADDVVAAMDDDAGDVGDLAHVAQQLVVDLEEAAVDEVMVLDPREGQREARVGVAVGEVRIDVQEAGRSEEHTSELQSLMRISYAVFCLKKNTQNKPST